MRIFLLVAIATTGLLLSFTTAESLNQTKETVIAKFDKTPKKYAINEKYYTKNLLVGVRL